MKKLAGLSLISLVVGIAFTIQSFHPSVSPLALCVAFGFAVSNFLKWPAWALEGSAFSSKRLMRIGVALLGAQVSIASLRSIGMKGVFTVIVMVSFTIFGILLLSKLFKMRGELGLLIGVGFGICGATAVAAIRPQTRATEEETSYAIGLISLCGTASIVILPFLGHLMNLSDRTFGFWAGAAVHDVGQVVATASLWSSSAVTSAIVIKLARVCLLAPIVLILAFRHRRWLTSTGATQSTTEKVPLVPLFVVGFLLVAFVHNTLPIPIGLNEFIVFLSKILIGYGLVALGAGVRWKAIRAIGPRPMAMGLLAWIVVGGVSLIAIKLTGL